MNKHSPYLIGLAGQSCAGKNEAAAFLAEKGFYIIDADEIAHRVLAEHKDEIIARYTLYAQQQGMCLTRADGSPDRAVLAAVLFADKTLLAQHEAFVLPKIESLIRTEIEQAAMEAADRPIVLNAPTLHKTKLVAECAFILYIHAPFLIRLLRARKRDKRPLRQLIARFLNQTDFLPQYLLQNADIVSVKNAGSRSFLRTKIEQVLREKGI